MPIPAGSVDYDHATVDASTLPAYDAGDSPYDLSSIVSTDQQAMTLTRGRPDEFSTVEPGSCSFRAEVVAFTRTPTADILPSDWIQVTEAAQDGSAATRRFRGRVDSQLLSWDAPARLALIDVTVTDRLAALSRHTLRSMLEEEILACSPSAYYTLGEPSGSTSAGDTSAQTGPALSQVGSGAAVAFGAETGRPHGSELTAATFAGGMFLSTEGGVSHGAMPSLSGGIMAAFTTTTPGTSTVLGSVIAYADGWMLCVMPDGTLEGIGPSAIATSTHNVTDGIPHVAALSSDGTTMSLVLDSLVIGTAAVASLNPEINGFYVGGMYGVDSNGDGYQFTGTISHVAAFPALTVDDAGAINAAAVGIAIDSTSTRAARIAGYAGLQPGEYEMAGDHFMGPPSSLVDVSALDALQAIAVVENSVVYVDGSGVLTMKDSHHRVLTSTGPALVIDTDDVELGTDIQIKYQDKTYLENRVTGTRPGGAQQQLEDAASIGDYDVYPKDLGELAVFDDRAVLNLIDQELIGHSQPVDRINQVSISLTNLDDVSLVAALLALEVGDRLQITGLPATAPFTTADLIVEGISENRSGGAWTLTLNTSPAAVYQRFVLGDPVFGVLGAGYHPAY